MNDKLSEDDAKNWMWKVIGGPSRSPGRRDGRCPGAGAMPGGGVGTGGGERSGEHPGGVNKHNKFQNISNFL